MKTNKIRLSTGLFIVGYVFGVLLAGSLTWAALENTFYFGPDVVGQARINNLKCPYVMTTNERGLITAEVTNTSDRAISPLAHVTISSPGAFYKQDQQIQLAIGETQKLQWQVGQENVDLGEFIFFKIFVVPTYGFISRDGSCGILFLNIPFISGEVIFGIFLFIALAGLIAGLWLREVSLPLSSKREASITTALRALGAIVLAGIFVSLRGEWGLGIIALVPSILIPVVLLIYYARQY